MRRSASEVIRSLEVRVARLERQALDRREIGQKVLPSIVELFKKGLRRKASELRVVQYDDDDIESIRLILEGDLTVSLKLLAKEVAKSSGLSQDLIEKSLPSWCKNYLAESGDGLIEEALEITGDRDDLKRHFETKSLDRLLHGDQTFANFYYGHFEIYSSDIRCTQKDVTLKFVLDLTDTTNMRRTARSRVQRASKVSVRVASGRLFEVKEALEDMAGVEELEMDISNDTLTFIMDKFQNPQIAKKVKSLVKRLGAKFEQGEMTGLGIVTASMTSRQRREHYESVMNRGRMPYVEMPPPIRGMEGPFRYKSGHILYYDPRKGKYYDRGADMYLTDDEAMNIIM